MRRKAKVLLSYIQIFIISVSMFASGVFAQTEDTIPATVATGVDTLIVVNGKIGIDHAIASAISHDTGIPVAYVTENNADALIKELKGVYEDVKEVVFLGGPAVISEEVKESIASTCAVSADCSTTTIAEATGTGTAVEAIDYFYGSTSEVTIVTYTGDHAPENEILHLAAQLNNPIIPIPADVEGFPAKVVETLEINNIGSVDIVGDFDNEAELKGDLENLDVFIGEEIDGSGEELEDNVEKAVLDEIKPGEEVDIVFVEKGDIPPVVSDQYVAYYKDENNDKIDDDSGVVLEDIGLDLYDQLIEKGANIGNIKCTGDDPSVWDTFESEIERKGETVDLIEYKNIIDISTDITEDNAKAIAEDYNDWEKDYSEFTEAHKQEFANALSYKIEEFKAFYVLEKENLPPELIALGTKLIDEANKDDPASALKLMIALENEYHNDNYVESCHNDDACRNEQLELEILDTNGKIERLVGTDRALEVANLDVGEKVGLLGLDDFVPPGKEEEIKIKMDEIAEGASPSEYHEKYIEKSKEEAYVKYTEELKKEYEATGKSAEAAKLTTEDVAKIFDERLGLESKAYIAGLVNHEEYKDPASRAEIMAKMEAMHKEFETKGVEGTDYLPSEYWNKASEKFKEGKLPDDFVKECKTATIAYRTWESDNLGTKEEPYGANYNSKKEVFSFNNNEGKVIAGFYDSKTGVYTYTNEGGELVQGDDKGNFFEYSHTQQLPAGYKYDSELGVYTGPNGETSTTPQVWDPRIQAYVANHVERDDKSVLCGGKGCEAVYAGAIDPSESHEGWSYEEGTNTWRNTNTGESHSGTTSYFSSSGHSGEFTSGGGDTWTHNSGTWTSSSGAAYHPSGHEGSYSYTSPTGETTTYSGGYATGDSGTGGHTGTTTGTYSGYTGDTSGGGSYSGSGGSAPSGGDTGGHSGGGDGGGGGTGHVIAGYAIYDSEVTRGWLSQWLFGER